MRGHSQSKSAKCWRILLLGLGFCLLLVSGGRFGWKANSEQCPTAPVQQIAVMVRQPDGSMLRELRAPRPGEKDFVVCHCQLKRAATQTGWFVPALPVFALAEPVHLRLPLFSGAWQVEEPTPVVYDAPDRTLLRPPAA